MGFSRTFSVAIVAMIMLVGAPSAAIAAGTDVVAEREPPQSESYLRAAYGCTRKNTPHEVCIRLGGSGNTVTQWKAELWTSNQSYRCAQASFQYRNPNSSTYRTYTRSTELCGNNDLFLGIVNKDTTWSPGTILCVRWEVTLGPGGGWTPRACKTVG